MNTMSRRRKLFTSVAVVVVVAALGVFGTFAAFTATTTNSGNQISAGTVKIDQHAGYTSLYNASGRKPGQVTEGCVRVTYTGSLSATVKLFAASALPTNSDAYTLTVERGSGLTSPGASMSCAGFSSSATLFDAGLNTFPTSSGSGLDGKASAGVWATNDAVDYRFAIKPNDDATVNAHTTDTKAVTAHSFVWEARNN